MNDFQSDEWPTLRHEAQLEFERARESACPGNLPSLLATRTEEFLSASNRQSAGCQVALDALSDLHLVSLEQGRYITERLLDRAVARTAVG
jgi:hypothetical protein